MAFADPSLVDDPSSLLIANQVVEGLVGLEPGTTSQVVPVLASALPTVSPDGLTYTFKLRTGVKFHDGTNLDAASVKANYERWGSYPKGQLQDHAAAYAAAFGGFGAASNLASVDAPDLSTVVFHLKAPSSSLLISQTGPAFGIQSPSAIAANDGNNGTLALNAYVQGQGGKGKAMVGTGPFMFDEWTTGNHVTLVRNPDYWDPQNAAYLDQIVFKLIADPTARVSALQGGSVDLLDWIDPAGITAIRGTSSVRVLARGSACGSAQILINNAPTFGGAANPLANRAARLAVAYAVQRPTYASAFYAGGAALADNWEPAGSQYYKREYLPGYDISQARSRIAESGLSAAGLAVELAYPSGTSTSLLPDPKGLAAAISLDLQAVGFTVTLKSEPATPNFAADQAAGKFQMWVSGRSCRWAGPDDFLDAGLFGYVNGSPSPRFNYRNDDLDKAMTAAEAAVDDATAKTAWQKAMDLITADMPSVPLLDVMSQAAAQAYVVGFIGSGLGLEDLRTVWLRK